MHNSRSKDSFIRWWTSGDYRCFFCVVGIFFERKYFFLIKQGQKPPNKTKAKMIISNIDCKVGPGIRQTDSKPIFLAVSPTIDKTSHFSAIFTNYHFYWLKLDACFEQFWGKKLWNKRIFFVAPRWVFFWEKYVFSFLFEKKIVCMKSIFLFHFKQVLFLLFCNSFIC